jgi:hypothetical protein
MTSNINSLLDHRAPESPFCGAVNKLVSVTGIHFISIFNNSSLSVVRSWSILNEERVALCHISGYVSLSNNLYVISFYFPIDTIYKRMYCNRVKNRFRDFDISTDLHISTTTPTTKSDSREQ